MRLYEAIRHNDTASRGYVHAETGATVRPEWNDKAKAWDYVIVTSTRPEHRVWTYADLCARLGEYGISLAGWELVNDPGASTAGQGVDREWHQIGGDVTASEYGAIFGQCQWTGDRLDGVSVVEVINMPEACGRDWDVQEQEAIYVTETSYCEVDALPWRTMKAIIDSCGGADGAWADLDELPDDDDHTLATRLEWMDRRQTELRRLARWEHRDLTAGEWDEIETLRSERDTYRRWFGHTAMQRAEMMHTYGGYRSSDSCTYWTLQEAMDANHIPQSALWRPSEYTDVPSVDDRDGHELVILRNVSGIGRKSGTDLHGCDWLEQFYGEIEDRAAETLFEISECPACDGDISEQHDREHCQHCGVAMLPLCLAECTICGKRIDGDAWANMDMGGDLACDGHMVIAGHADD